MNVFISPFIFAFLILQASISIFTYILKNRTVITNFRNSFWLLQVAKPGRVTMPDTLPDLDPIDPSLLVRRSLLGKGGQSAAFLCEYRGFSHGIWLYLVELYVWRPLSLIYCPAGIFFIIIYTALYIFGIIYLFSDAKCTNCFVCWTGVYVWSVCHYEPVLNQLINGGGARD